MPSQTTKRAPFSSRTFSSGGMKWVTLSWLRSRLRPTSVSSPAVRRIFFANNILYLYPHPERPYAARPYGCHDDRGHDTPDVLETQTQPVGDDSHGCRSRFLGRSQG